MIGVIIVAVIGLLLSLYTLYVEGRLKKDKNYKAVCDIGNASCTRVFSSEFGKTLGISNGIWGILLYVMILALVWLNLTDYVFYISIIAFLGTLYLAYTSYFRLKDFCLVCSGIYIVNVLLLVFSWLGI
ncbi:hypothetical protein COU62_01685 [Candidatus Pacearchaeota archaeon CG10_big_fil_rev_8_21_14_0_10_35_219]|nr:vitamin K epoxide reductase family protein [Candidatus Pacearchaeota archaeon]OIO43144.1 MAG: hypothetical protein AUJ63_00960 [Candidatus Pacearchaeota archaeon CG1_02_35_32]PIO08073.1 MAG: hypothetical protein COU62_01685 [Candidatus Pacearchaeota archaeon CG10_big_fil_rev_8_21_14_0_10_35_219]PIY81586.1 MAG: hypothetical protein COY79_02520 [Candidatus Pacearchaeota archaeon CG_4_10_14_0_8_um_filter_35_169]PIZ78961.1 MAG: hypothetical protein COY00_04905 [Candidatus Pacearchaeota archaeon 